MCLTLIDVKPVSFSLVELFIIENVWLDAACFSIISASHLVRLLHIIVPCLRILGNNPEFIELLESSSKHVASPDTLHVDHVKRQDVLLTC